MIYIYDFPHNVQGLNYEPPLTTLFIPLVAMALIHMWLGPAQPQSCKRWLQGKFGGKAPEGMEF